MKSRNLLWWSAVALVAAAPVLARAAEHEGYVTSRSDLAVHDGFGGCVHTGWWHPGMRFDGCEPRPAAAPVAAPIAAPVEPAATQVEAPAPQPMVQSAPEPVRFQFAADAMFDFDRATLKSEAREVLDRLIRQIAAARYKSVEIVGHTDRLGAASYNRRLSEHRAQAVRDYLVGRGLDARVVSAKGVGSAEPLTAGVECAARTRAELIQCLSPDRYAEVTLTGEMQ